MTGERVHQAMRHAIQDLDSEQHISDATAREALELLESSGYPAALQKLLSHESY